MSHQAATHADATHHDDGHASHPHVNYLAIFIALCVCTLLSVVFDMLPATKPVIAVLVLAIAVAKAQFVMRYFMHLKFEGLWKYVLLLPTAILACGLPLALAPDIALHYYTPEHSPYGIEETAAAEGHHAAGEEGSENSGEDTPAEHAPAGH
ncbi:MAG: cytochrome C oxidase subunit IV family protein [Planctomycetaceae bacterium]|nr:cytochrome C oxidase subunit IV family protein [Planctomycetaceae bacterium]